MNMKTKHTPGPWIFTFGAVYQGDNADALGEPAVRIALADRGDPKTQPTERDANCRLIAAAPELLEALERLCGELHTGRKFSVKKDYSLLVADAAARTAIAKAKGD